MTPKEYLQQIQDLDNRIKAKESELEQLWCNATSITAPPDKEPISGSFVSDKVGMNAVKIAEMVQEIEQLRAYFLAEKAKRVKAIDAVENPLFFTVLHKCYVEYKPLTLIAEEECYSYQYIVEVHGKALKKVKIQ